MQEIIIEPYELWDYLEEQDKTGQLDNVIYDIAHNEEFGTTVYVTKGCNGKFCISVEADDVEIYSDDICNREEAEKICKQVYDDYLTDRVIEIIMEMQEESQLEQEDEIELREEELSELTLQFIMDILGGDTYFDGIGLDKIVDDCKEHFLEYLSRKHELSIYRPMILEDENGDDFFEEYPYECMIFEDEDNPIYQP